MMSNWKFFIARRIYRSREGEKEVSKPAVRIAMAGIAIGLAVMIVSVAVVIGFKHQVRDKVIGMGSDIVVSSIEGAQLYQMNPVVANDSLLSVIRNIPQVSHVQRYATKPGMIMTADNFQGRKKTWCGLCSFCVRRSKPIREGWMNDEQLEIFYCPTDLP